MNKYSIDNIQAAAKEIREFKPITVELTKDLKVSVHKLPGEKFDEALVRFMGQIVPLFDDDTVLTPEMFIAAIQAVPEAVSFFVEYGTDLSVKKVKGLLFDERVLLMIAVVTLTFIDAAGVRCFLAGLPDAGVHRRKK